MPVSHDHVRYYITNPFKRGATRMTFIRTIFKPDLLTFAFFALLNIPIAAHASTAVISGGQLTGFNNVIVGSNIYNVTFDDGSFMGVFGGMGGLDFDSAATADVASMALLQAIEANPLYDTIPELTAGIGPSNIGKILTPYTTVNNVIYDNGMEIQMLTVLASVAVNVEGIGTTNFTDNFIMAGGIPSFAPLSEYPDLTYADWTMVAPVPVPAAVWFMGSGLLGLIGFSRKKHQVVA